MPPLEDGSALAETLDLAQLRLVLAAVSKGIVLADEHGEVLYRNEAAEWIIGRHPSMAVTEQVITRLLRSAVTVGEVCETLELHDGPRRTLVISARSVKMADPGDRPLGAVAVVEDVTEKRRLEAVRRDFVSNISHELKTPVGALALLAETLVDEEDLSVIGRLAGRIQAEAQRVARIMDDLLDLSRIESEQLSPNDLVSMPSLVREATDRIRSAADQRGIVLRIGALPGDRTLVGDRRQLISAVYNLLENAVKYSDPGSAVEVDGSAGNGMIELRVSDHGIGIPREETERIFERFYRVDQARARDTGGTGLGLAIVRHVVSNHGGDVLVSSVEGVGSTFTLRLQERPRPGPPVP